jgi:hypothetical protein
MRPIGASAITVAGVMVLWFVATRPLVTDAAPLAGPAPISTDVDASISGVIHPEPRNAERPERRNAFGYVEPPPVVAVVQVAPPIQTVPPPVVVEAQPTEEAPPRFEYRYIGRFGNERDPIIAFAADGDVLTIRRGDRIGEGFILQSIGLESVELVDARGRILRRRLGE